MIQFNLLPDIKKEYIKTQRIKRLVMNASFIASAAALAIFLILASSVYVVQKKSIHDLKNDIDSNTNTFKNIPNISDALTVQSQLGSLSTLHAQKPSASRLFSYLTTLTPNNATISNLKIDFTANTLTIDGNAPGFDVVNTFVDILKFTTYSVQGGTNTPATPPHAFSSVVVSTFSRGAASATYEISCSFDPLIFNNANVVTLKVGGNQQQDTQQPSIIFKQGS